MVPSWNRGSRLASKHARRPRRYLRGSRLFTCAVSEQPVPYPYSILYRIYPYRWTFPLILLGSKNK